MKYIRNFCYVMVAILLLPSAIATLLLFSTLLIPFLPSDFPDSTEERGKKYDQLQEWLGFETRNEMRLAALKALDLEDSNSVGMNPTVDVGLKTLVCQKLASEGVVDPKQLEDAIENSDRWPQKCLDSEYWVDFR